jgi:hypothetical protein
MHTSTFLKKGLLLRTQILAIKIHQRIVLL